MKLLGLLGLTCVMVSGSYFCTTMPGLIGRVVGWIGVTFFGLGFIAFPVMSLRTGPQIIINDDGIEDRRLKVGVIRWEEIRWLSIGSVNSAKFLCVDLVDPGTYLSRLPRWKRSLTAAAEALGFPGLAISFSGLSPGLKEAWAYIQARHRSLTAANMESRFLVRVSDTEVACERPDGKVECVGWADLQKIEVVTTDEGPFVPDVFWVSSSAVQGADLPAGEVSGFDDPRPGGYVPDAGSAQRYVAVRRK